MLLRIQSSIIVLNLSNVSSYDPLLIENCIASGEKLIVIKPFSKLYVALYVWATNIKRDTFHNFSSMAISQSSKIQGVAN